MMKQNNPFNKDEFKKLLDNDLIGINDVELIILKGHILIEYIFNNYIESHSTNDQFKIEDSRFQFSQKVKICSLLGLFESRNDSMYKQVILINRLRNEIAHRLSFEKDLLDELYDHHKGIIEQYKNADTEKKDILILTSIISHMCSYLLGKFTTQIKMETIINEIIKTST